MRVDHKFASGRDQVFGRLTHFRDTAVPVTPFPDGSGAIPAGSVAIGPQKTRAWAFASNYQHTFSSNLLNELRIGDTRRSVERRAAELPGPAGAALNIPGIPTNGQFPNTIPTFAPNGYQQLGSPTSTASDFNTSVTQIADSLTWLKGRHTVKLGFDWRWERLNVIQPPSPTGTFTFSTVGSDLPGVTGTGNAFRELPARTGAELCDCLSAGGDPGTRAHSGVLHPGRLEGVRPSDDQSGPALYAELPVDRDQRSDRRLQPADPAARLSRRRARAAAQEEQLRPSHRRRLSRDRQDDRQFGVRAGVDRNGRHYHAVHDADVSVPPGSHAANARQHCARLRPVERADGDANRPHADRRARAGRVHGRRQPRLGLCPAMERLGAAGADAEHRRRGVVPRLQDQQRRHPGQQRQSVDRRAVADGRRAAHAGAEPVLRDRSALVLDRRSHDHRRPVDEALSGIHGGQLLSQQCRRHQVSGRRAQRPPAAVARADVLGGLHAVDAEGHRLVGVRRLDSHRTVDQRGRRRQLQSGSRLRLLDGRHSALFRRRRSSGICRSARAARNSQGASSACSRAIGASRHW